MGLLGASPGPAGVGVKTVFWGGGGGGDFGGSRGGVCTLISRLHEQGTRGVCKNNRFV